MPDKFGVLFIGDLIGRPGRRALARFLPDLRKKYEPDLVVANAENAAGGNGLTEEIGKELLFQVDILTSGNHIWDKKEVLGYMEKENRLLRPANYPVVNPGRGHYLFQNEKGIKAAVINLQGRVFMEPIDCPFLTADRLLEEIR
ncbi:MAG: YmdB family metallophosphoesterase, partial [Candidatus Saccharicenans sp.]|nr:YmdB family metallophosphoesterase [Candidatus Saccharicenans sp.]